MLYNTRLMLIAMFALVHISYSRENERNSTASLDTVPNSTYDKPYNANNDVIRKQRQAPEIPSFAFHKGREGVRTLDSDQEEINSQVPPPQIAVTNFSYYDVVMEGNNKEKVAYLDRRYADHDVNQRKRMGRNEEQDYSRYLTHSQSDTTEMSYYRHVPRYQGGVYADNNPSGKVGQNEEDSSQNEGSFYQNNQSPDLQGVNTGQVEDKSRYQDIFYKETIPVKTYPENSDTYGNRNQYYPVYNKEPTFSMNVPDKIDQTQENNHDRPSPSTVPDQVLTSDHSSSDIAVAEPRANGANDAVSNYYDFLINEGSYKFWAVFQVITAILLIYSAFAAIYYAKYTFSMMDYPDYLDDGFFFKRSGDMYTTTTTTAKPESFSFLGLSPQTFQRIMNALSSKKYS
ncbi:hypothetical protein C0J52_16402 [Blattella germanica]|nr:hypothetical protein C0J52_16402 [Blattella germanica]